MLKIVGDINLTDGFFDTGIGVGDTYLAKKKIIGLEIWKVCVPTLLSCKA